MNQCVSGPLLVGAIKLVATNAQLLSLFELLLSVPTGTSIVGDENSRCLICKCLSRSRSDTVVCAGNQDYLIR